MREKADTKKILRKIQQEIDHRKLVVRKRSNRSCKRSKSPGRSE